MSPLSGRRVGQDMGVAWLMRSYGQVSALKRVFREISPDRCSWQDPSEKRSPPYASSFSNSDGNRRAWRLDIRGGQRWGFDERFRETIRMVIRGGRFRDSARIVLNRRCESRGAPPTRIAILCTRFPLLGQQLEFRQRIDLNLLRTRLIGTWGSQSPRTNPHRFLPAESPQNPLANRPSKHHL